jgi:hypothetical protein
VNAGVGQQQSKYMSAEALLALAVLLGVAYVGLALATLSHIDPSKKAALSRRWPAFFFYWPFYPDMYLLSAKALRIVGAVVAVLLVATWITWWNIQHV